MLNIFLHAARASQTLRFMWHQVKPLFVMLLDRWSPVSQKQAAILALPHLHWRDVTNDKNLIELWAAATSVVPYTDEICCSVVDTLLQIASDNTLWQYIPIDMWSWANRCPLLPPLCAGRYWGSARSVVQTVQALDDIEILTSYFYLVWSEWDHLRSGLGYLCQTEYLLNQDTLPVMHASIREDFSGIEMGYYRTYLLKRLDYILGELDLGLDHFQQHVPNFNENDIQQMKTQYKKLKWLLHGVDRKANKKLMSEPPMLTISSGLLIPINR